MHVSYGDGLEVESIKITYTMVKLYMTVKIIMLRLFYVFCSVQWRMDVLETLAYLGK